MIGCTFHKSEHLKSAALIKRLFAEGQSFASYPLRFVFLPIPELQAKKAPVQVTFTVSKKAFAKAVHRNRIKRQVREAYRLNKSMLAETFHADQSHGLALMILYIAKDAQDFKAINKAMTKALRRLIRTVEEKKKS